MSHGLTSRVRFGRRAASTSRPTALLQGNGKPLQAHDDLLTGLWHVDRAIGRPERQLARGGQARTLGGNFHIPGVELGAQMLTPTEH